MSGRARAVLEHLLPPRLDNAYRGHPLALWLFVPVVVMKTGIALATMFNGRVAAQSSDGLALDRLGPAGAEAVVTLFALWGLAQLMVCVLGALALVRYRAMVPLMFLLLTLEHVARRGILLARPLATPGMHPGTYVNLALLAAILAGLALALWPRPPAPARGGAVATARPGR